MWWSFHSLACVPSYLFINNNTFFPPPGFILGSPSQINHIPPYISTCSVPWAAKVSGTVVELPCPFVQVLCWTQPQIFLCYIWSVLTALCRWRRYLLWSLLWAFFFLGVYAIIFQLPLCFLVCSCPKWPLSQFLLFTAPWTIYVSANSLFKSVFTN